MSSAAQIVAYDSITGPELWNRLNGTPSKRGPSMRKKGSGPNLIKRPSLPAYFAAGRAGTPLEAIGFKVVQVSAVLWGMLFCQTHRSGPAVALCLSCGFGAYFGFCRDPKSRPCQFPPTRSRIFAGCWPANVPFCMALHFRGLARECASMEAVSMGWRAYSSVRQGDRAPGDLCGGQLKRTLSISVEGYKVVPILAILRLLSALLSPSSIALARIYSANRLSNNQWVFD